MNCILESMHNCAQWPSRTATRSSTAATNTAPVTADGLMAPRRGGSVELLRGRNGGLQLGLYGGRQALTKNWDQRDNQVAVGVG